MDHSPQCWSVLVQFYQNICLLLSLYIHINFIYISQGSVEMHLQCSVKYINHIIANCLQSVPVKDI